MTVKRVRVLIFVKNDKQAEKSVQSSYHQISKNLSGTPGLLSNELLCSIQDKNSFIVMSEWHDMDSFQAWEKSSDHRRTTAPLRPHQDHSRGSPFGIYTVRARYMEEER